MLILGTIIKILWRAFKTTVNTLHYALFGSGIAVTIGLLANAVYIDVFEASKIAYTYWSLIGLLLALAAFTQRHEKKSS